MAKYIHIIRKKLNDYFIVSDGIYKITDGNLSPKKLDVALKHDRNSLIEKFGITTIVKKINASAFYNSADKIFITQKSNVGYLLSVVVENKSVYKTELLVDDYHFCTDDEAEKKIVKELNDLKNNYIDALVFICDNISISEIDELNKKDVFQKISNHTGSMKKSNLSGSMQISNPVGSMNILKT